MKKKGKIIEIPLPEDLIQHIQSYMSTKEAARSAILSKSWYNAWLTRPTIDLDTRYFSYSNKRFTRFVKRTIQRYQDLNMKIQSFRLHICFDGFCWPENLIVKAMELGATDVELDLPLSNRQLPLPQEVLGSKILVRLSLNWSRLDGNYFIRCSMLKSLTLEHVDFEYDDDRVFKDLTTCCISLEELAVSSCFNLTISRVNLNELHKLKILILSEVDIDSMFFTDFASRFPCLKELAIIYCYGSITIDIASTSLETISYKPRRGQYRARFDVPNIRKFTFASCSLPTYLSIKGALNEWEFDVSISSYSVSKMNWLLSLTKLLRSKFKRSKITSLSIGLRPSTRSFRPEDDKDDLDKAQPQAPKPLLVDNLRIIDTRTKSSCALLVRLFGICRPKFITHCLHSHDYKRDSTKSFKDMDEDWGLVKSCRLFEKEALNILCEKLMQQLIAPNCGIPDQDMFGRFGLKRVNMEVYDKFGTEWRPLEFEKPLDAKTAPVVNKRKIRFELIWD